jgi:hypothetical protein
MTFKTRPSALFLFLFVVISVFGSIRSRAQVAPSAFKSGIALTAGATVSVFNPSYVPQKLGGVGAYVDLNLFHGLGLEAEGRWQRFHEFAGISQDNYLVGPRYKVRSIWKLQPYAKGLVGFSNMNFENNIGTGRFTTIALGGGIDLRLTRRISLRAVDAEYQIWPSFLGGNLKPYGLSAGIGYRIF